MRLAAMLLLLALPVQAQSPRLLPPTSPEGYDARHLLEMQQLESTMRIQSLIAIGVALLLGVAMGAGATCIALLGRSGTQRLPRGVCGQ